LHQELLTKQAQVSPVQLVAEGEVTSPLDPDGVYPFTYQVKAGDSLWKISQQFYGHGCYYKQIAVENSLQNPDQLTVGMELVIPASPQDVVVIGLNDEVEQYSANNIQVGSDSTVKSNDQLNLASEKVRENSEYFTYQVEKGDSLWFIALKYYDDGSRWPEIYQANKTVIGYNPDLIHPGARLNL
jgi:nucleoid-associated protein YgaU